METREEIALFDRYMRSEMNSDEKITFEARLAKNKVLQKKLNEYQAFSNEIKAGMEYTSIQKELTDIHSGLYDQKKSRSKIFKPAFLIPIGIAATIALLVLFNPFDIGMGDKTSATYEPLANNSGEGYAEDDAMLIEDQTSEEMVDFEEKEVALLDSLTYLDYVPYGTAFLISKDGYFLTSKHLVAGEARVQLQQKDLGINFEAKVVYCDSVLDLAILQSSKKTAENFEAVPFEWYNESLELGEEVFTLGYPKKDIVYTRGVVSSETGYESDSIYFEVSLPSNAGHSGAPLFNNAGNLIGIITAHHSEQQSVTYVLKHRYIQEKLTENADSIRIDMTSNYTKRRQNTRRLIKLYRPFIFEVH